MGFFFPTAAMLLNWEIGEYYLAVRCRVCDCGFAFLHEDETDETFYFTDSGEVILTCPDCCFSLAYTPEQIKRIQAQ
jgi:Zn-finger protein